jgi:hypothetical protein
MFRPVDGGVLPTHRTCRLAAPRNKENNMVFGGGILVTILIVLAIIYLAKRV